MSEIRVLYLPLNSSEIVQTGMYDAFAKANVNLKIFDFNLLLHSTQDLQKQLIQTAAEFNPHLIHMQLQFTDRIFARTIQEIKRLLPNTIITNWTGDVRSQVQPVFVEMGRIVDISLVSSSGQVEQYKKAIGGDVRYWQIGYDPAKYFCQNSTTFSWDAVFAASNHVKAGFPGHQDRVDTVKALHSAFGARFGLFGIGWKKYNASYVAQSAMNAIYNQSISCISVSNFNDLGHYFSDRLLMCMASGRPTVSLKFPGWEDYFTNNLDIVIADSVREIPQKVQWLKENPERATSIGKLGAEKVYSEHSYYSRVKELLHITGLR